MTVNMQHESERLEALCTKEEKQIKRLSDVLSLIDTFEERTQPGADRPLSLDECADLFLQLQVSNDRHLNYVDTSAIVFFNY